MKRTIALAAFIFSCLLFTGQATAHDFTDSTEGNDPKIIVAKVHADWCGSCKAIEPAFRRLKKKLDEEPVLFLTFDMTNEYTLKATAGLAEFLLLADILSENQKTGKLLVIEAESQTLLKTFNKKDSLETIQDYLEEKLAN